MPKSAIICKMEQEIVELNERLDMEKYKEIKKMLKSNDKVIDILGENTVNVIDSMHVNVKYTQHDNHVMQSMSLKLINIINIYCDSNSNYGCNNETNFQIHCVGEKYGIECYDININFLHDIEDDKLKLLNKISLNLHISSHKLIKLFVLILGEISKNYSISFPDFDRINYKKIENNNN
jgi:uncharacterized protein with HEPN domain